MPTDKILEIFNHLTPPEKDAVKDTRRAPARFGVLTPSELDRLFLFVMRQKFKELFAEMERGLKQISQSHVIG